MVVSHTTPLRVYKNESVSVLLPLPLTGPYDYFVPPDLEVSAGDFVVIPLGRREIKGVVWGNSKGELEIKKLRISFLIVFLSLTKEYMEYRK